MLNIKDLHPIYSTVQVVLKQAQNPIFCQAKNGPSVTVTKINTFWDSRHIRPFPYSECI